MEQLTPLFRSKRVPLGLLAALLVAFLLSLPYLASEQLWYDEVLSRSIYTHSPSLPAMTTYLAQNENHPPFYYYLMFGWTRIFGASPLAIRFPSVIFTVATVGLLYGLCREWFNRRTAVLAALLYALSPMAVEYSREARPYTLIAALSVASWWILVRWLKERPGRMLLPAFCLLTLAGLYTHYAYLFLFLVQCFAVFLSFSSRRTTAPADGRRRAWLWAILAIVAGFLPWLPVVIENFFRQYIYPEGLEPLSRLVMPSDFIFLDLFFNFLFFPSKWPVDALGRTIQAAVAALFAVGGVLAVRSAWRTRHNTGPSVPADGQSPRMETLIIVLLWLLLPPVLFLFSPMAGRYSWYYHRHLLAVLPAFCVILAISLQALQRALQPVFSKVSVPMIGVLVLVFINFPQYFINDSTWDPQHQFANAAGYIEAHDSHTRELIIGFWPNYRILIDYYYRGGQTVGSLVPEQLYRNQLKLVTDEPLPTAMEGYILTHPNIPYRRYLLPPELVNFDRIWVVSVTPNLFDLDVAFAAAGFRGTFVEPIPPLHYYLFHFDRFSR